MKEPVMYERGKLEGQESLILSMRIAGYSYRQICDHLKENGIVSSESSVRRMCLRLQRSVEEGRE